MYSPIAVYSRFGGFADTVLGRDAFIEQFKDRIHAAGWNSRKLRAYMDVNFPTTADMSSAKIFLSCPSTNDGNWAVFDNINHLKVYVIDQYVPDPPNKMACLLPGASDGTYTSLGYVETGEGKTSPTDRMKGVKSALNMLGFEWEELEQFKLRIFYPNNTEINQLFGGSQIGFSSNTNGAFTNGGYVFTCQPSTRTIYRLGQLQTYGEDNQFELALTQSSLGAATVTLRVMAAKKFPEFPWEINSFGGSTTIDGGTDTLAGTSVFRSQYFQVNVVPPWVFWANPYSLLANADTDVSASRTYIEAFALKLMDTRYQDTQHLPFQTATFFAALNSAGGGLGRHSIYNGYLRRELKTNYGYHKVRYNSAGAVTIPFQGQAQMVKYIPGRAGPAIGAVTDGPWFPKWREACEPWIGWGMTGEGAGDLNIIPGQIHDCFGISEDTADPVGSQKFAHDGKIFKKWTKRTSSSDVTQAFTLCVRVDTEI